MIDSKLIMSKKWDRFRLTQERKIRLIDAQGFTKVIEYFWKKTK